MSAVIAVTGDNPHGGQSLLSANLALYLNRKGHRTGLLVTGATTPLWGVTPVSTWPNILSGRLSLDTMIQKNVYGIDLMVTQHHGHMLAQLTPQSSKGLFDAIEHLDSYAYILVDMPAGVTGQTMACCLAATETILVLNADTATLSAGYEWLSQSTKCGFTGSVNIVLQRVRKPALGQSIYARFRDLAQDRLNIKTNLWGSIGVEPLSQPHDMHAQPLEDIMPNSRTLKEIHTVGDRLIAEQPPENQTMSLTIFWQNYLDQLQEMPFLPLPTSSKPPAAPEKDEIPEPPVSEPPLEVPSGASPEAANTKLDQILNELRAIRKLLENR